MTILTKVRRRCLRRLGDRSISVFEALRLALKKEIVCREELVRRGVAKFWT